jgi:hypothetical protein
LKADLNEEPQESVLVREGERAMRISKQRAIFEGFGRQDSRLERERERLQPIPTPWPGAIQSAPTRRPAPLPRGYEHPLRVYEELIPAVEVA